MSVIAAMDENRGIGIKNHLPWHLAADLKRFKKITMGHHVIMGRRTFESIGKCLIGRTNFVISRNPDLSCEGCVVFNSLEKALRAAESNEEKEVFIIGGGEIFSQAIDISDRLYLTIVNTKTKADVTFPQFDRDNWVVVKEEFFKANKDNQYPHTFLYLKRKKSPE